MRCVYVLLITGFLVLVQLGLDAIVSYIFGPMAFALLSVAFILWVSSVLLDCWYLSALDDDTLASVQWLHTSSALIHH
jgi:hypothetical protein